MSIAVGVFGPGWVQCGTLGAKLLIGWEVMNAAGDVATAGKHLHDGNFGWGDALSIAGAGLNPSPSAARQSIHFGRSTATLSSPPVISAQASG